MYLYPAKPHKLNIIKTFKITQYAVGTMRPSECFLSTAVSSFDTISNSRKWFVFVFDLMAEVKTSTPKIFSALE